jgi:hypothetical protein
MGREQSRWALWRSRVGALVADRGWKSGRPVFGSSCCACRAQLEPTTRENKLTTPQLPSSKQTHDWTAVACSIPAHVRGTRATRPSRRPSGGGRSTADAARRGAADEPSASGCDKQRARETTSTRKARQRRTHLEHGARRREALRSCQQVIISCQQGTGSCQQQQQQAVYRSAHPCACVAWPPKAFQSL